MPGAGELRERFSFQKRLEEDDGHGNKVGDFVEQFVCRAKLTPRLGGEAFIASRMQGSEPATLTIHSSKASRCIDPTWRAVNVRNDKVYDIQSVANPDQKNQWLDVLAVGKGDNGG